MGGENSLFFRISDVFAIATSLITLVYYQHGINNCLLAIYYFGVYLKGIKYANAY